MRTDAYQEALDRKATRQNMAYAKGATTDAKGNAPPSSKIWRSVKHKDFPRNIRFFLWMLIHGAYKVGSHWEKIPGYEDWGKCQTCGVTDTAFQPLVDRGSVYPCRQRVDEPLCLRMSTSCRHGSSTYAYIGLPRSTYVDRHRHT